MQTTTNYGYNLVESTDTCNVPVQISPNFTKIDNDLKAVSDAAITSAVDTFASNTHALVRDDADRNYLFFVAPADYTAGDTFTLDGVTINATNVAGEALETNAFRVNSVVAGIVYGTRLTLMVVNPVNIPTLDADNVTYDNTVSGLTASDVQAAIDEIEAQINNLPAPTAGNTSYNNTISGLIATNVQQAIDELKSLIPSTPSYTTAGLSPFNSRCTIQSGGYYIDNGFCYVDIIIAMSGADSASGFARALDGFPASTLTASGDVTGIFNDAKVGYQTSGDITFITVKTPYTNGKLYHFVGSYQIRSI